MYGAVVALCAAVHVFMLFTSLDAGELGWMSFWLLALLVDLIAVDDVLW